MTDKTNYSTAERRMVLSRQAFAACTVALIPSYLPRVHALFALQQPRIFRSGQSASSFNFCEHLGVPPTSGRLMSAPAPKAKGDAAGDGEDTQCGSAIILGSKSSTRRAILEELGFTPIVRSANIDERAIGDRATWDPSDLVLRLGVAKAEALLPVLRAETERGELTTTMLLTGDQVVVHEGRILEKPADEQEARRNIAGYARSPCRTVGSVILTDVKTGKQVSGVDSAEIFFAEIPEDVVDKLCHDGEVLQCAGGLMVEHPLVNPYVTKIEGSTIDSVMGLSKPLVLRLLQQLNDEEEKE